MHGKSHAKLLRTDGVANIQRFANRQSLEGGDVGEFASDAN